MRIAVMGLGFMGSAFAGRFLETGTEVQGWNRTPGKADGLVAEGLTELASPDAVADDTDAIFVSVSDDKSVLALAVPEGNPRSAWAGRYIVVTSTVSADAYAKLVEAYGDRFLASPVLAAPAAVRKGAAILLLAGSQGARTDLAPLWEQFSTVLDLGETPATASIIKLLNTHMMLANVAVYAETVRIGREAGVDDKALAQMFDASPTVPEGGLRARLEGFFDPDHKGWFSSPLAAKDLGLTLALASSDSTFPVTAAARDSYLQVAKEGWADVDITGIVEYGNPRV
ncbi:NAD(P)-dependent oxidoreductase [Subtercola lobariae]|uniref:Tartronate semialdehyde reductase n=1 Tax=Subtercola lobariae TaxID=1588641 RepID=A0A917EZI2_9MICO|nr:NAD(P)-binding domain-containing protein [Subtercola lobariae]GGF35242.1 tartronate semialdehyde reductase [Subtercola lobariae]